MRKRRRTRRPIRRSRRAKPNAKRLNILLWTAGFVAYTALAGIFGAFLADRVFIPIMAEQPVLPDSLASAALPAQPGAQAPSSAAQPAVQTPAPSQSPKVSIVEDIVFPRFDYYALQVGAFSTEAAAYEEAASIRKRGGAGYIVYDVRHRVLANVYLSESDARSVKTTLMESQGIDSYIYAGAVPLVELTITAPQSRINAISSGYQAWRSALELLRKLSDLVDKGDMTPSEAYKELGDAVVALEKAQKELNTGASVEDENGVLEGLSGLIDKMLTKTRGVCAENAQDAIAFSASIKYNYVEAVFEYKQYIEGISSSFL